MSLHHNAHGTSAPASRPNRAELVHHGAGITSVNVSLNYGIAAENIRNFVIKTSLPNDKTGLFDNETGLPDDETSPFDREIGLPVDKTGPFDRETGYSVQDRDFLERMISLVLNNRTRKIIEILFEEYGL